METLKLGNTEFRPDLGKLITFKEFKSLYSNVLEGISLEEAYKKLGGKIEKPKKTDA